MEDLSNISSEEELLRLHDEGKISEDEYRQLSDAMRKRSEAEKPAVRYEKPRTGSKRALGVTAFCIMVAGFIMPGAHYVAARYAVHSQNQESALRGTGQPESPHLAQGVGEIRAGHPLAGLRFLLFLAFEIAAFVLGVIAWPDVFGKATVVCLSSILVLVIVFTLLFAA